MYSTPDQFAAASKAGVENFFSAASTGLASFEKLVELNVSSTKALFDEAAQNARAALAVKDAKELLALNVSAAQPAIEKSLVWSKEAFAILSKAQATLRAGAEEHAATAQKEFAATLDKALKSAPPGTESAVAALRSAVAAATSAYDNAAKVAKQAFDTAESNFTSAASTAAANVAAATKAAAKRK
jgi:phasin family protein